MSNIIEVKNFTKKFGDFVAVDDISFTVEEGSIFGFLGSNGAGKSTTINALCTILDKTKGDLKINGYDISKQKDKVRNEIGIVFQESTLDSKLTIEENIKFHCEFYNVPKNEIKERIDFVLNLVDLTDWKKAPVGSLSGGMKRRVELARGLVHYPKVLFLDEPTTGLDPQTRANIWSYIYKLQKEKNITIFLTTHYMDEAEICDKVAIMNHGKITAYDTPYNLEKQYTSNVTKIRVSNKDLLIQYLKANSIKYKLTEDLFKIYSEELKEILSMVSVFKDSIIDFETTKGTLNDVFLAVTGKEIG
ncbi:daunorubicin resistance protein DrrA family ABC transporter ATP-binding protein [Clostridium pasteurianum]|uniref:Daunorubicin resistance ABC transporter ATP-binding subunit n=1 Tax=Clostridium pasteurianum BC1 TaxID=86416 RepID=R4KFQ6_CLOPA|nr:daunorubicin resistance protein DrrA family ABC transporter ATP-binding protein [Clostridium pasteurianum]AGK99389.1 daunorubicin resistance ABC transporter ATP-binding subunit [Clostridium pasteurianum BC1]